MMAGQIGSNLQSSPAVTCMKILLLLFNFIFWLSGIAILVLGIWMKVELYMYMELTTIYYNAAPYILIGVGTGIVVFGSFGCLCTLKGQSCLLYMFSVVLMLIFIIELATAITAYVYKNKLRDGFRTGLVDAMKNYRNDVDKQIAVDKFQRLFKCCGSANYTDWYSIDWSGDRLEDQVPGSCCSVLSCTRTGTTEIYTGGCYNKLSSFMESNFNMIGGIAIGFSFIQLVGAMLSCCLAKNIKKAKYEQVA